MIDRRAFLAGTCALAAATAVPPEARAGRIAADELLFFFDALALMRSPWRGR